MKLKLSAPGKTFLAGEYAVLNGGPALILTTGPRFELSARPGDGLLTGIPVGSPAYRLLEEKAPILRAWDLDFTDPHAGAGGFGASGAQFLFAHVFLSFLAASVEQALAALKLADILSDFKRLGQGSGSDILSQAVGGVARVEDGRAVTVEWPFADLQFAILRTGHKVATHEHLRGLDQGQIDGFLPLARDVAARFASADEAGFLQALGAYAENLAGCGLQAESTLELIVAAGKNPWCLLAKGCGALGADTMLLLFRQAALPMVREFAAVHGLPFTASREDLGEGLKLDWSL